VAARPVRNTSAIVTRVLLGTIAVAAILGIAGYVAFQVSPWPSALIIRRAFEREAVRVSAALAKHVPPGVAERLDEHYDPADADAHLDVYYPAEIEGSGRALPTVVWVHGGGWVSGNKGHVANYARILASKGYTVVAVGYSIAPRARYPTPPRQLAAALAYLKQHAERLHVDPSRIFLAGDSAGAQIAAQVANAISAPSYATAVGIAPPLERSQLAGVLLYCGAYDVSQVNLEGAFGAFLSTVLWSYSGTKAFMHDPRMATVSVIDYVTADFPPMFISSGNTDPLTPQSRAFAAAVAGLGVPVDSLFFPRDYAPALPHEYQFNLDTEAGQLALERSVAFLSVRQR
jgi:acetyl esterase/lipase